MRDNVRAFVEIARRAFAPRGPVYEFGSYQVDDQAQRADLRGLFDGMRYIGCDMRPGPGVDRVEDLAALSLRDASAPTILCLDTLEHVFEARRGVDEMLRALEPGGIIILSAPLHFHLHAYPSDYWRITPACMARMLEPLAATLIGWQGVESFPHTVLALGMKAPVPSHFMASANDLAAAFQAWLDERRSAVPITKRVRQWLAGVVAGKGFRRRAREHFNARFAISAPARAAKGTAAEPSFASAATGGRIDLM